MLRLVSPHVLLAIIVVLPLEFKFSHILAIGFLILAECFKFHHRMMQNFDNHWHSFLKIIIFYIVFWDSPRDVKSASFNKLSLHFDLERGLD